MRIDCRFCIPALSLTILAAAAGDPETILIQARRVYTAAGKPIEGGKVVVRDGKILEVGAQVSVAPGDPGVRNLEITGALAPGFIDCGSDIGVRGRAAEEWRELTPEVRALDGVDFDHPEFERAASEGVTLAGISPGARNVVGGLGAVVRTGPGDLRAADRILARDSFLAVSLADEAAAGNQSLRFFKPASYTFRLPNTRMGTVFLARRAFFEVLGQPVPEALPSMLVPEGKKLLEAASRGELPLRVHADHHQEILAALRFAEEFHLKIHIAGFAEGRQSIPEVSAKKIPVLLYPGTSFREAEPARYPRYSTVLPAALAGAGISFAFFSGDGDESARLRERVALSLRFGLTEDRALDALTIAAARILGVENRTGSIEAGKDADLIAFSGEPFDLTSSVLWVMARGRLIGEKKREF